MKKTKLISLLLAAVMLFSCFTASFTAFAAGGNVKSTVSIINSVKGKIDADNARPQAVAKYQAAVDAFNALSDNERENLDIAAFSKLLGAVYTREEYLLRKEGLPTGNGDLHKKAAEVIKLPAYVEVAATLYTAANGINDENSMNTFLELLKTASGNAIALAGCFDGTYFGKKASDKECGKLIDLAAQKMSSVTSKEGDNKEHYFDALKAIGEANSEAAYAYNTAAAALAAFKEYLSAGVTESKKFNDVYSSLATNQKTWLGALESYSYSNYKLSIIISFVANFDNYSKIEEYKATVENATAPYTNKDIENVKKAYKAVPQVYRDLKLVEQDSKYRSILSAAGKDTPSSEQPDLSAYKVTDVSYKYISEDDASMLADVLVDLVLSAANVSDATELVNTKILTNKTVVAIAGFVFPALEELTDGLIYITPESLSGRLTEEKYSGAAAALEEAYNDWENVNIKSGDFGFEDGDTEGFIDAVTAVLRGASLIHLGLKFENNRNASKGIYYGGYEDFIEIFETLDINVEMDSEEYTAYVKNADNRNDAKIRAILVPIVSLITDFANDPIGVINEVLPKIAYAIDSGIIDYNINNLLEKFSLFGFTIPAVDLTTSGIYNIINDKLLDPKNIRLTEDDFSALIEQLSGCGKAVSKPSKQSDKEYRLAIDSDKSKSVIVLISFVLDTAADNRELVSSLLDMANVNPLIRFALTIAISASATFIPRRIAFSLISLFVYLARIFTIFK